MGDPSVRRTQTLLKIGTAIFLLAMVGLCIWAWRAGLFRDVEALQSFIDSKGAWAPLIFLLLQRLQILMAFVPGGILLSGGVVIFGPWMGFVYNILGTLLGSALNFALAKRWGRPLAERMIPEDTRKKYFKWLDENERKFERLFAVAILLPFFPDDALCLIAGLTKMRWPRFLLILLLKAPTIAAYSLAVLPLLKQ